PVLEVVFRGQAFDGWIAAEIAQRRDTLREAEETVARLKSQVESDDDESAVGKELAEAQAEQAGCARSLERYVYWRDRLTPVLPSTPFGTIALMMGLLVMVTALKGVCVVAQARLVARVAEGTVMDLRRSFYRGILHMDQQKVDQRGSSMLMTQLSHNISLVGAGLKNLYGQSIREPLKMLSCLIAAAFISWQLLLISMLVAPLGAIALRAMSTRVKTAARGHMGGVTAILKTLGETVNGIRTIKIFNRERTESARFKRDAHSLYVLSTRMSFYDSILNPVTEFIGIVALSIAILCGAWLVLNEETRVLGVTVSDRPLKPSTLFLFFGLLAGVSGPARKLSGIYNSLVRACMSSERLFTMFEETPTVVAKPPPATVPIHCESIRLENVCFAYRVMHRVVHNVDLEIPYRQTVALVGHNGCGKTTLMHLVARFYDPVVGNVFLDGVNLRNMNPRVLRRQFAMITQAPFLFDGTIEENIAYGAREPSADKIRQAAALAQVDGFIDDLPQGWQTKIGDGGKFLSGGQRQRVALARAIVGDPRILILDEATSQFDPSAERAVHECLREFLLDRTVLMITHRRSTLDLADRVLVMKAGRLIDDL
ncbi:MAG: ABC transporter ATP-binding protein, partial [Planctomycetota bacterium]